MPKLPRNLSQARALRAFIRAGGMEVRDRGKGSHVAVLMPNGHLVVLPRTLKVGLLAGQIRAADLTVEEFIDLLNGASMTTYTVLVYEAEPDEGGYWATVAELPGCGTTGETMEEIEDNIRDAIETYIEALKSLGKPIPQAATRKLEIAVA